MACSGLVRNSVGTTTILSIRWGPEDQVGNKALYQSDKIWSAGVSPRVDPRTEKIQFWVFLARFGPRTGPQNFPKSPRPPQTSKSRISRKTWVEPPNVVKLRKLRNATAVQLSLNFPGNFPVAPSYG